MDEQTYPAAHEDAARLKRENVAIEAASAEVAAGGFVTLAAVEAWIDS